MQQVTQKWKENQQKPLTSEGFVEVVYTINDPNVEAGAESTGTPKHELSITSMPSGWNPPLVDETEHTVAALATLEQDLWLLDGSKTTVSDINGEYGYTGFISRDLCDEDGSFEETPRIQLEFNERVPILPGLIITWSTVFNDYPVEFKVTIYDSNGAALDSKTVLDNTDTVSMVILEMNEFDRIDVEVLKWATPHRRARIERIFPGLYKAYTKKNLLGFTSSQSIDVLSASLPKYDVSFEVDNRDGDFDPLNPEGLSKYMMERQEISTRYGFNVGGDIEWIRGGVYYLSDWSAPQNGLSASFSARDLLGFLNGTYFKGRFPKESEPNGISLYTLALEVLQDANLPQRKTDTDGDIRSPWELDEDTLGKFKTTAPLPIRTYAQCLQMIANAAGCTIFFDRNGMLNIKRLDDDVVSDLNVNDRNSYSRPEIELTKPVKQIDVSMHSFIREEEAISIYEGTLPLEPGTSEDPSRNEFIIEFSDMAEGVEGRIDAVTTSNGAVISTSGVNVDWNETEIYARSCKLVINSTLTEEVNCKVSFTGQRCRSSETIITTPNLPTGETQPLRNTLITNAGHAQQIGRWLKENLNRRKHISLDWRADPQLDVGDIITVGESEQEVRIVSSNFNFSGAFKGKVEGVVMQ